MERLQARTASFVDDIRSAKNDGYTDEEVAKLCTAKESQYTVVRRTDVALAERLGFLVIGEGARIHETVEFVIGGGTRIYIGPEVVIKAHAVIHSGVDLREKVVISNNVVIEEECVIGKETFIGNGCVLRPQTVIGDRCTIGHLTVFEGQVKVGECTLIHAQCHITRGVTIGKKVFIAPLFVGANDPSMAHCRRDILPEYFVPYKIKDGARIAVGVTVLPGLSIGKNAVIGAGAVVTKDVMDNAVVVGVPAKQVRECGEDERL